MKTKKHQRFFGQKPNVSVIKNILIIIFVLAVLSIAAYSVSYSKGSKTQVTADIELEEVEDCEMLHWTETEPVYGTCTNSYDTIICDDEPFNTSCYPGEETYEYKCKTGEKEIQKSKEICKDTEMKVTLFETEEYSLEYGEWGKCSYTTESETLVITCDSKYDGNNDGICHPGESCIQFRVTGDKIQRLEKNSRLDFIEEDSTFFLNKLSMEEVK